jgi:hypothetical protein
MLSASWPPYRIEDLACRLVLPPYKFKGSWPIETYHPIDITNVTIFPPNPSFSNPLYSFVSTTVEEVLSDLLISGQP